MAYNDVIPTAVEGSTLLKGGFKDLKGPIGPYRLDRYILEAFMIQGFSFDKKRSQYIRYVFGIFDE